MEEYKRTDEVNLENEQEFLIALEKALNSVESNIIKLKKDVPENPTDKNSSCQLDNVLEEEKIQTLIHAFPKSSSTVEKSLKDNEEKISALEAKCDELRAELQSQANENKTTKEEIERLKTQFQNKIGEFLLIVNGSFMAFISTYEAAFPPTSNAEYQFVIALLGIVTNISASAEGREFLITNPSGKDFVYNTVKLMPSLPLSTGSLSLKRLMLMILYNVSMNKTGLQNLFEYRIGNVLNYCLENKSLPEEMQVLGLRVLQSITYDLTEPRYIRDLISSIPIERIEDVASSNKSGISAIAKEVIKHLRTSQKFMHAN
ncbi:hypothetical protein KM043_010127 [Ampulex compressa]|nr:hypothetical protein KM043_010127 [Ampulex compressa]